MAFVATSGKSTCNTWFKKAHLESHEKKKPKRRIINIVIRMRNKTSLLPQTHSWLFLEETLFFVSNRPVFKLRQTQSLAVKSVFTVRCTRRCGLYQWTPRINKRKRALPYDCNEYMASSNNLSTHPNQNIIQNKKWGYS